MEKYISILKSIKEANGTSLVFTDKYPDMLIFLAEGGTKRKDLKREDVDELRLILKSTNLCNFIKDKNDYTWVMSSQSEEPGEYGAQLLDDLINWMESEETLANKNETIITSPIANPSEKKNSSVIEEGTEVELEDEDDTSKDDTSKDDTSLSDMELYNKLLANVHSYMTKRTSSLTISINNEGNFLDNGELVRRPNSSARVKALKRVLKPNNNTGHEFKKTIEDAEYTIKIDSIGDHTSIDILRELSDESYELFANKEILSLVKDREVGGIIVASSHTIVGLEPIMKMFESGDNDCYENLLTIGKSLPEKYNVPNMSSDEIHYHKIKSSPFRYVLFGSDCEVDKVEILDLVLAGKIVVLGYQSSTLYGLMTKFEIGLRDNPTIHKQLMLSVTCFVRPVLKSNHESGTPSSVSLSETEVFNMNHQRAIELISRGVTIEEFNSRIEFPAKVHQLTSSVSMISQEDEFLNLLRDAVSNKSTDIFIVPGSQVKYRINSRLIAYNKDLRILPEVSKQVMFLLTSEEERASLETKGHVDTSYSVTGLGRFRIHICIQRSTYSISIRPVKFGIPSKEEMNIPQELVDAVVNRGKGMVITTGATGMGKSTTNAILVQNAFSNFPQTLVSIGDPCEYLYQHGDGIVIQREIPLDAPNFESTMESMFRSNPNIIEIGELRSKESVEIALRAGSSSHLFFCTLHTGSVMATFHSVLNRTDKERRQEIMETLSQSLTAIINQVLVRDLEGNLFPVFEYLIIDDYVRTCLAGNDLEAIEKYMNNQATMTGNTGVRVMEREMEKLFTAGQIHRETYERYVKTDRKEEFLDRVDTR